MNYPPGMSRSDWREVEGFWPEDDDAPCTEREPIEPEYDPSED